MISEILLSFKYIFFILGKLTVLKSSIFSNLLAAKLNCSKLGKLTFLNTVIFDILLLDK